MTVAPHFTLQNEEWLTVVRTWLRTADHYELVETGWHIVEALQRRKEEWDVMDALYARDLLEAIDAELDYRNAIPTLDETLYGNGVQV